MTFYFDDRRLNIIQSALRGLKEKKFFEKIGENFFGTFVYEREVGGKWAN